jgi:sugar phosphate isomerase/epimerase
LACPDWSWERVLTEASRLGYDGIELRIVDGELDLPSHPRFRPERIGETLEQLEAAGLVVCCLDSSCSFHEPERCEAAVQEGLAHIDLARRMNAPYVRVFGDAIPDPAREGETIARVAQALERLGQYAEEQGVMVLLESHGGFSASDRMLAVMAQTRSPAIGILWDIDNPYKHAGESVRETFARLAPYIKHTHIKDSLGAGADGKLTLPGEGDLPIGDCLGLLAEAGYDGWLSFEWEKKWVPQLAEPEVALPAYIDYIRSETRLVNAR